MEPKTDEQVRQILEEARNTNADRDLHDEVKDVQSPTTGPCWQVFRTIMMAIESGFKTGDENCFAEAYAMAEEAWPRCMRMEEAPNRN